jgi:hypothetical protein
MLHLIRIPHLIAYFSVADLSKTTIIVEAVFVAVAHIGLRLSLLLQLFPNISPLYHFQKARLH